MPGGPPANPPGAPGGDGIPGMPGIPGKPGKPGAPPVFPAGVRALLFNTTRMITYSAFAAGARTRHAAAAHIQRFIHFIGVPFRWRSGWICC